MRTPKELHGWTESQTDTPNSSAAPFGLSFPAPCDLVHLFDSSLIGLLQMHADLSLWITRLDLRERFGKRETCQPVSEQRAQTPRRKCWLFAHAKKKKAESPKIVLQKQIWILYNVAWSSQSTYWPGEMVPCLRQHEYAKDLANSLKSFESKRAIAPSTDVLQRGAGGEMAFVEMEVLQKKL